MSDMTASILGRIPSGIFILTAIGPDQAETGMLASWVQQAGFEPPAVTVAVNSKRYIKDWMQIGATVALSQVSEQQKSVLGHFGKGFEPGAPAFEGVDLERSPANLPVLKDCVGWMEGKVTGTVESGDHVVVLIEVTAANKGPRHDLEKPFVHLRKNGMKY